MKRGPAAALLSLAVAACQAPAPSTVPVTNPVPASAGPATARPGDEGFASVVCPDEVTVVMVLVPTCGYLMVPERREPSSPQEIRVFVVRIAPPGGIERSDAMVAVGEALGGEIEYGGLAILAGRTGRAVYIVDRRGTGLSEPALDCPEITAASGATLALPSGDPAALDAIVRAVQACRDRLLAAGIDLGAYGLRESALDIEALRVALGLEPWNVIAFGSASRLALEVARQAPEGVRTVVLDSPVVPQGPDPMFASAATAHAVERVDLACAAIASCADVHADFSETLASAVEELEGRPIKIESEAAAGGPAVTVLLDGTRFGKAARNQLAAAGGGEIDDLLDSVAAAADGRLAVNDYVIQALRRDDALCLGYVPDCRRIVHGSLLSTTCAEVLPFVDRDAMLAAGADVPGMAGAFQTNPFFAACAAWDLPPDPMVARPIEAALPILAMVGLFDPFTGPSTDLASAQGLQDAVILEVPAHSYNVFGYNECPRQVRREWLDDPDHVPDTSCFADLRTVDLSR